MKKMTELPSYLFEQKRREYRERRFTVKGKVDTQILRLRFSLLNFLDLLRTQWKEALTLTVLLLLILIVFTFLGGTK